MPKPKDAERAAVDLVLAYLDAMEARDLDQARALLSPGFEMHFPGTGPMTEPEELIAWARHRYRTVRKTTGLVECLSADDSNVVYVRGTLSGEWPDGTRFAGIRYIDRFEVAPDLRDEPGGIRRIDVWNDIAEVRAA